MFYNSTLLVYYHCTLYLIFADSMPATRSDRFTKAYCTSIFYYGMHTITQAYSRSIRQSAKPEKAPPGLDPPDLAQIPAASRDSAGKQGRGGAAPLRALSKLSCSQLQRPTCLGLAAGLPSAGFPRSEWSRSSVGHDVDSRCFRPGGSFVPSVAGFFCS